MTVITPTEIWHLSDYESEEKVHSDQFKSTMDNMKAAQNLKQVKYFFGYSNLTFDLWMVLHRSRGTGAKSHRRQYLADLNRAYEENFEDMPQYKREENFKRCLSKISLNDVKIAVTRAKALENELAANNVRPVRYRGFSYYEENPVTAVWQIVEKILRETKLLKKD